MTVTSLPMSALLSQVLVAFTIELDNEFERLMPHRTTVTRADAANTGPWLISFAFWSNILRCVPSEGIAMCDLQRTGRPINLGGLVRWGYIRVSDDPAGPRSSVPGDLRVTLTRRGARAAEIWNVLPDTIEQRWVQRYGEREMRELRGTLDRIAASINGDLPPFMPVLGHGMRVPDLATTHGRLPTEEDSERVRREFPALLTRVLLSLTVEFERASSVSLPVCANLLRVVDDDGTAVRDLPRRSGVSKEAIAMMSGFLRRRGFAVVVPVPATGRTKQLRLTATGAEARERYSDILARLERDWTARCGRETIQDLRASLHRLVGNGVLADSPLAAALTPPPEGWRARVTAPEILPHYPMVLHRGGFPDGS